MSTKQRLATIQSRPTVLHEPRFSQFDEQDEATVREIWHAVEKGKPLGLELVQQAGIFDTKHPGAPIYQVIQGLNASFSFAPCHSGVKH